MTTVKQATVKQDGVFSTVIISPGSSNVDAMLADYAAQAIPLVANGYPAQQDELILTGLNLEGAATMAHQWNIEDGSQGDLIIVDHTDTTQQEAMAVPVYTAV